METQPVSEAPASHACAQTIHLWSLLRANDVDAALDSGLMDWLPCHTCEPVASDGVTQAQRGLAAAWSARDRYRARNERLALRAAERIARRATTTVEAKPGLPAGAAAALARAKARAADRKTP